MASSTPLQTLEGTLERLTYQNEENGYTVARVIPDGKSYEVTVVGPLAGANVGESLRIRGVWTTHPQYGRQFEVQDYTVKLPATVEGIRKYLGSGLIKGVGPVTARRIVDYFGLQTLDIIEEDVHQLREVPGVGPKRAKQVAQAWEEQKQIKEIMLFLQSHGVSTSLAVRIYKHYGDEAAQVVQNSPYRLARDVYGIGFKTADRIAQKMGIPVDAPERIQAGLRYALSSFSDDGHCYAAREALVASAAELLEVPGDTCRTELDNLIGMEEAIEVPLDNGPATSAIYLPPFYYAEQGVAGKIRQLLDTPRDRLAMFQDIPWDIAFGWLEERRPLQLVEAQRAAIKMALTQRFSILTGGPGTGKSTITGSLIDLLRAKGCSVLLAAPTGRAAKRLNETTGLPAKTIHRLLEFKPGLGNTFLRDRENPLDADLIIVDEASMIDILLMNHLLKAVEAGSHLLLVGDVDQLPSVGPGNVLRDLIGSGEVPVTRLETIFRQSEDSYIIVNAHRINQGQMPIVTREAADFFLFKQPDPEVAADLVVDIVARRIPGKFGHDPRQDIQVLSPMHRGAAGVSALNQRLQAKLNPPDHRKPEKDHGSRVFRQGDRVMQIRNDYERQVFNGDMGAITNIDLEDHLVTVDFEDNPVAYEFTQLDELVHAYAVSVHKSQGSEFPAVVIPILTQHYMMLQRNLLYTAVTRARQLVVLVGTHRAIAIAVHNNRIARRNTRLAERLIETAGRSSAAPYAG
ncbi:MAG: SF1B family DNA helicase RecD2 [Anaerolineae bacterium]